MRGELVYLVALVVTRISCAFQFQSITALEPFLAQRLDVAVTAFGFLLGLYMAPGFGTAVAAPWMSRRFGNHAMLLIALAVMALGQALLVVAPNLGVAAMGRLIAGLGGCVIYISTVDLAARAAGAGPLPLRMGAVAASWPAGNALALLALGTIGATGAYHLTGLFPIGVVALAALLLSIASLDERRDPERGTDRSGAMNASRAAWARALRTNLVIGLSFASYNVAFVILISFSPSILRDAGYAPVGATSVASLPMWLFLVSVPLGGVLASLVPRHQGLLVLCALVGAGVAIVLSGQLVDRGLAYAVAGALGGLPASPMLARAERVDPSGRRDDLAYSAFFLIFFTALLSVPVLAGALIDITGTTDSVLWLIAGLVSASLILFFAETRWSS